MRMVFVVGVAGSKPDAAKTGRNLRILRRKSGAMRCAAARMGSVF
jgi:hypothetical protein